MLAIIMIIMMPPKDDNLPLANINEFFSLLKSTEFVFLGSNCVNIKFAKNSSFGAVSNDAVRDDHDDGEA